MEQKTIPELLDLIESDKWEWRDMVGRLKRERAKGKCEKCKGLFRYKDLRGHHVIPIKYGGENTPENTLIVCLSCEEKEHRAEKVKYENEDNSKAE